MMIISQSVQYVLNDAIPIAARTVSSYPFPRDTFNSRLTLAGGAAPRTRLAARFIGGE